MTENFANTFQTTLNDAGGISSGDTSLVVSSATGAPAANFRIKIDDELMLVTNVASTTFTVTRGIEGTSAASHSDGATVTHVLTAGGLLQGIAGDNYQPDAYPSSPDALDDEFRGGGTIDAKWTAVNDPGGADALNQTDIAGYLHVGLLELGTDNFANLIQLYQTAPTGTAVMEYVAKIATAVIAGTSALTDAAEFAGIGIALINSTNSQAIGVGLQFNDAATGGSDNLPLSALGFEDLFSGFGGTVAHPIILPGTEVYVKFAKTTTAAYTSANTYEMYVSGDGRIWQQIATGSKTFTTACDRVGLLFRRPKSATGTPYVIAIADFFRRTV